MSLDFYTMRFWSCLLHFFRHTFMVKLKKYINFWKLCLVMPTFLLSSKSNCFHRSDSSDMSEGPNENYVETSFDKATSDKRNVKQIALHNGKWWTWADPRWWLGAKGKFEATHMFPLEGSLGLMSSVCISFKMENEECLIIFPGYDSWWKLKCLPRTPLLHRANPGNYSDNINLGRVEP